MRTTLDIDDDVLQAAKELAKAEKKTAGQVLSELARQALTAPAATPAEGQPGFAEGQPHPFVLKEGWYVRPSRGRIVTNEMINRIKDELDLEDAGLVRRERPSRPRRR